MPRTRYDNMAELLEQLGGISPSRVRVNPSPGKATERDVLRILDRENRLYELVDGTLVEKTVGLKEAALASSCSRLIGNYLELHDLGFVAGADGTLKLMGKLVRIPDVSYFSWDRLPSKEYPSAAIPDLAPDLAVEVLSEGNTVREIERKLKEYFMSETRLVWVIDPKTRTVKVFTAPDRFEVKTETDTLDGGDVLPGFTIELKKLFERVPRTPAKKKPAPKRKQR